MANRIKNLCRILSVPFNRIALANSRSALLVEATTVERRLPLGTSGVHALGAAMKYRSILCHSLTVTIPIVFLVVLYRIGTPDIHSGLNIPLSGVAVLIAVVSLLMLMNIITSRSILRQIRGDSLFELFESADDTMQREMCDELESLYNSNRMRLAKGEQIGLIAQPWFYCIQPKSTEILDALEDTLEAWRLSMNPVFRRHIQKRIDELEVDGIDATEERENAKF